MAGLADLTDQSQQPMQRLYVSPLPVNQPQVDQTAEPVVPSVGNNDNTAPNDSPGMAERIANRLFGLNGEERYQTWPEKLVRDALTPTPEWSVDPNTGDVHTSPEMIKQGVAASALGGTGGIAGVEEGADAALGSALIPIRDVGSNIGHETLATLTKPNHFYRGMSEAEYNNTIGAGKDIKSNQTASIPGEGTNFSNDARDAESYANFGRTDPRKTGTPNYLVEIKGNEGLNQAKDGYFKAPSVPIDRVTRVIKMEPNNGAIIGSDVLTNTSNNVALGSAPFLRPALKYQGKIYKAPMRPDAQHLDAIPDSIYPEFQRQAMSGEDISNFNFGFMNHKGQFLNREDALDYAIKEGLLNKNSEAARAGTLTSTLMSNPQVGLTSQMLANQEQK